MNRLVTAESLRKWHNMTGVQLKGGVCVKNDICLDSRIKYSGTAERCPTDFPTSTLASWRSDVLTCISTLQMKVAHVEVQVLGVNSAGPWFDSVLQFREEAMSALHTLEFKQLPSIPNQECAYFWVRTPFASDLQYSTKFQWDSISHPRRFFPIQSSIPEYLSTVARMVNDTGLDCCVVSYLMKGGQRLSLEKYSAELGVRFLERAGDLYEQFMLAIHVPLFITEGGSHWASWIPTKRTLMGKTTEIFASSLEQSPQAKQTGLTCDPRLGHSACSTTIQFTPSVATGFPLRVLAKVVSL